MASETVEFSSIVPRSEYEYFRENFPQYGAVKWFINTALLEFNNQIRENPSIREQINKSIEKMVSEPSGT